MESSHKPVCDVSPLPVGRLESHQVPGPLPVGAVIGLKRTAPLPERPAKRGVLVLPPTQSVTAVRGVLVPPPTQSVTAVRGVLVPPPTQRVPAVRGVLVPPPMKSVPAVRGVLVPPPTQRVPAVRGVLVPPPTQSVPAVQEAVVLPPTSVRSSSPVVPETLVSATALLGPQCLQEELVSVEDVPVPRAGEVAEPLVSVEDVPVPRAGEVAEPLVSVEDVPVPRAGEVAEPRYAPMSDIVMYSASRWRKKWPELSNVPCYIQMNLWEVHDEGGKHWKLCKHVGYHKDIIRRLLQHEKFVNIIARSATLCARQKKAVCFSVCKSGRHRSVAACVCLQYMFRKYVSPSASIKVQHLESDAWAESTCAGKCNVCVAPLPQDVCAKLDEIWAMLPFRQDVPEVRVVEL